MEGRKTKYLNFIEQPNPGRITQLFYVYSKTQGDILGVVQFKPGWRRYVYESSRCVYDIDCMTTILDFLRDLMAERKEQL